MPTVTIPKKKPRILEIKRENVEKAVERFNVAMEAAESRLVDRSEEMEALKLCIVTKSHLMMEGKHGIAKSLLARQAFSRITGAETFTKMLMKTTQTDELFGPLDTNKYREESVWCHNIKGYLPTAHFAFLDEVYRASEQALPSTMCILNERLFVNGDEEIQCPLITCVGTTNFTIDTEELKAFHDRWHVVVETQPLTNGTSIRKMFQLYLAAEEAETEENDEEDKAYVSLEQIESIHNALAHVEFSDEMLELSISLAGRISTALGNKYISDRRKCIALRFAQANAVLEGRKEVLPEDLDGLKYAFTIQRNHTHDQFWTTTYNSIVGGYAASSKDTKVQDALARYASKLQSKYDPKMSKEKATDLWKEVKQALNAVENQEEDERPKTPKGSELQRKTVQKLESLIETLKDKVAF